MSEIANRMKCFVKLNDIMHGVNESADIYWNESFDGCIPNDNHESVLVMIWLDEEIQREENSSFGPNGYLFHNQVIVFILFFAFNWRIVK